MDSLTVDVGAFVAEQVDDPQTGRRDYQAAVDPRDVGMIELKFAPGAVSDESNRLQDFQSIAFAIRTPAVQKG